MPILNFLESKFKEDKAECHMEKPQRERSSHLSSMFREHHRLVCQRIRFSSRCLKKLLKPSMVISCVFYVHAWVLLCARDKSPFKMF
jgi:hypothetical protein